MSTQQGTCDQESRGKISEMLQSIFSIEQPPKIISCYGGGTAWASFSYLSAEVAPASFDSIAGFEPLNDPAWFPMDLLAENHRGAFEGADWSRVMYRESFHPQTKARIFLIRSPDDRAFIVTTSE